MDLTQTSIELSDNNLYRNGEVHTYADGESVLIRKKLLLEPTVFDEYHVVTEMDRIDKLAHTKYKDKVTDASKYWWVIADANDIKNPFDLSEYVGRQILIPDIITVLLKL